MSDTLPVITYSLRDSAARSDDYYRTIAAFTDEVVATGETLCGPPVAGLQDYLKRTDREIPRTRPEYLYDLLTLGVLWRCYASNAARLSPLPRDVLTRLAGLREHNARLKSSADALRGVVGAFFLRDDAPDPAREPELTMARLDPFLSWLAATGNFTEAVERLRNWRDYFLESTPAVASAHLRAAQAFAGWFETRSVERLGRYTPNVERFLSEVHPRYRWRADAVFCGRRRVEYHLSMIGTEILNRAFREAFLRTARKIVLVPPCMRFQPEAKCKARSTGFGAQCRHCTPQCHVHQVSKLGEKYGFAVFMIPDELSVFAGDRPRSPGDLGIVGVSCVLTNAPGGWETKRLGVPAQGLPLDYCGCHWHWHKDGFPTSLNFSELLRLLSLPA